MEYYLRIIILLTVTSRVFSGCGCDPDKSIIFKEFDVPESVYKDMADKEKREHTFHFEIPESIDEKIHDGRRITEEAIIDKDLVAKRVLHPDEEKDWILHVEKSKKPEKMHAIVDKERLFYLEDDYELTPEEKAILLKLAEHKAKHILDKHDEAEEELFLKKEEHLLPKDEILHMKKVAEESLHYPHEAAYGKKAEEAFHTVDKAAELDKAFQEEHKFLKDAASKEFLADEVFHKSIEADKAFHALKSLDAEKVAFADSSLHKVVESDKVHLVHDPLHKAAEADKAFLADETFLKKAAEADKARLLKGLGEANKFFADEAHFKKAAEAEKALHDEAFVKKASEASKAMLGEEALLAKKETGLHKEAAGIDMSHLKPDVYLHAGVQEAANAGKTGMHSPHHPDEILHAEFHDKALFDKKLAEEAHGKAFLDEELAKEAHSKGLFDKKLAEEAHGKGFIDKKLAEEAFEKGLIDKKLAEEVHGKAFIDEKLAEEAFNKGLIDKKLAEEAHSKGFLDPKLAEEAHEKAFIDKKLAEEAHGKGYFDTKLAGEVHSKGFFDEKLAEEAHEKAFIDKKLAEEAHGKGYFDKKLAEEAHSKGFFDSKLAEEAHEKAFIDKKSAEEAHSKGFFDSKLAEEAHKKAFIDKKLAEEAYLSDKAHHVRDPIGIGKALEEGARIDKKLSAEEAQFVPGFHEIDGAKIHHIEGEHAFEVDKSLIDAKVHAAHDKVHHPIDILPKEKAHEHKLKEKAHKLKEKFFHFLGRIFHSRKLPPHLVTMRKHEFIGILKCIHNSRDPIMCEKFAKCEMKMPPQVIAALEKCQKETIPGIALRCSRYEPLFPSPEIPYKIFDCIVRNTRKLMPEEKKLMIDFEECARKIHVENCSKFRRGLHF